ncbi:MAG: acyl-CoA thioesterase [Clostridiales bacterium]|nr:acyl-CoA thioesterase [Clostridiales bacterium]
MKAEKTPEESVAEQVQVLTQSTMNGANRLFGGRLMEWIDIVAAVVARRHSEHNVTTVLVETLEFLAPAVANSTIVLKGRIVYVGRASMVVRVTSYVEELNGTRTLINSAYLTMVALGEDGRPCPVPKLTVMSAEDKAEWDKAETRRNIREAERKRERGGK